MQAIREIRTVEEGKITLHLPRDLWGQQVEIIVLPVSVQPSQLSQKKSLRGCLEQYAQPDLISVESEAWAQVVRDRYEPD